MIGSELAELLESPCSLIVGTVDADGPPDAGRFGVWRCSTTDRARPALDPGRGHLPMSGTAPDRAHGHPLRHAFESVQLKGRATHVE